MFKHTIISFTKIVRNVIVFLFRDGTKSKLHHLFYSNQKNEVLSYQEQITAAVSRFPGKLNLFSLSFN